MNNTDGHGYRRGTETGEDEGIWMEAMANDKERNVPISSFIIQISLSIIHIHHIDKQ